MVISMTKVLLTNSVVQSLGITETGCEKVTQKRTHSTHRDLLSYFSSIHVRTVFSIQ